MRLKKAKDLLHLKSISVIISLSLSFLFEMIKFGKAQSPDLNPIELLWEQLDRMVRKKCPSSQSNLWEVLQKAWGEISTDYLNKLTARMPKVCNAVIAANGAFFDESKVWRTKLIFQIKIIISNFVNVLTIFSIHFATHLINKSVSFHGKHEIVWVTPNF